MKWRPIKTAPKDRLIILAQPPHEEGGEWTVLQGRWIDVPHTHELRLLWSDPAQLQAGCRTVEALQKSAKEDAYWVALYDGIMVSYGMALKDVHSHEPRPLLMNPSHWMPLPPAPKLNLTWP